MKIGPVDIRNHGFSKKKMRGCDEGEVAAFLELVADRLEEVLLEAEELRDRIHRLENELNDYRDLDRTLRDSLLSAERLSDGRLEHAEREARIILKNAEMEGEKRIAVARTEANAIRASLDELRGQRLTYVERFRALLRSQMKILEASVESYAPDLVEVEHTIDRIQAAAAHARPESAPSRSASDAPSPDIRPSGMRPSGLRSTDPPPSEPDTGSAPAEAATSPGLFRPAPPASYLGEEGLFSTRGNDPAPRIEED